MHEHLAIAFARTVSFCMVGFIVRVHYTIHSKSIVHNRKLNKYDTLACSLTYLFIYSLLSFDILYWRIHHFWSWLESFNSAWFIFLRIKFYESNDSNSNIDVDAGTVSNVTYIHSQSSHRRRIFSTDPERIPSPLIWWWWGIGWFRINRFLVKFCFIFWSTRSEVPRALWKLSTTP